MSEVWVRGAEEREHVVKLVHLATGALTIVAEWWGVIEELRKPAIANWVAHPRGVVSLPLRVAATDASMLIDGEGTHPVCGIHRTGCQEPLFHQCYVVIKPIGYHEILVFSQRLGHNASDQITEKIGPIVCDHLVRPYRCATHDDRCQRAAGFPAERDDRLAHHIKGSVQITLVMGHDFSSAKLLVELEQRSHSEASVCELLHLLLPTSIAGRPEELCGQCPLGPLLVLYIHSHPIGEQGTAHHA
mmetsp:Transcript_78843/g.244737  ORF Transcript_78843/g.244737 Transcript_78843/m.244737 type:complete len:245 (+) Transcript_78843:441-1175(+)